MAETESGGQSESTEKKISIKNPDGLAKSLGYRRNENIPEKWYKEFLKPLPEGKYATLAFQNGKYGGYQRIIIGIKMEEVSSDNEKEYYLSEDALFKDKIKELGLKIDEDTGMFDRPGLNDGGYQKLYPFLLELENSGFYTDLLEKIEEKAKASENPHQYDNLH
jgi:hypothetical protein